MLVAHSMGSHGGQQNFPFGYIPNELHGIGLPDFMTPGPPPGQPLLSEHDTQNLDSFLNGFDAGGHHNKEGNMRQFQNNMNTGHEWMMPPTFVRSETSLRPRNGTDWQNFQMADFTFSGDMSMENMNHSSDFHNSLHGQNFATNGHYDHNLLSQLHNAAQTVQPSFAHGWQQDFQPQPVPQAQQQPRPMMRFGSDSHFQPTGYAPPDNQFDHTTTPNLDWLEAHSSAPNTQPNTEPNTEPSSPNWPKKRKLDDYQGDRRRNGYNMNMNNQSSRTQPTPPGSAGLQNRTFGLQEQHSTTNSRGQIAFQHEGENAADDDEDADYDEDDVAESVIRSASPPGNSKTKPGKPAPKVARTRKKSTASNSTSKSKSKGPRNSISAGAAQTSRVPLTADQKKANHTNSEQRRRDATARSYAELYDLVPELEEVGKQSTMKKLEVVVSKVQRVKARVRQLRAVLGFDIETGAPLQANVNHHTHHAAGTARSMGNGMSSDMTSWS